MTSPDHVWKSAALSKQYLEGVRGAIPLALEQIALILHLVNQALPKVLRFLDLGCGDGVLGRAIQGAHPEAAGVFVDFSEAMLAAARGKASLTARSNVFLCEDYGNPSWVHRVKAYAPFDVIVSGFSIHHQPNERKQAVYRELFDLLAEGGIFLNLEHVASASPWLEKAHETHFIESLRRYHQSLGSQRSMEEIAEEFHHRADKAANILSPVEVQCDWLREIGFVNVDCYFKALELALFGGTKTKKPLSLESG